MKQKVGKSQSNPLLTLNANMNDLNVSNTSHASANDLTYFNGNDSSTLNSSNNSSINDSSNRLDSINSSDPVNHLEEFFSSSSSQVQPQSQLSQPLINLSSSPAKPVPIKSERKNSQRTLSSSSAPTSASSSPILGSNGRPAFFLHRKSSSNSSGGFNMFLGK